MKSFTLFLLLFCAHIMQSQAQQPRLFIDSTISPAQMVTDLFSSPKVAISNVKVNGQTYSIGYFEADSTKLDLIGGILLTTGLASEVAETSSFQMERDVTGNSTDADLQGLVPGGSLNDVTAIEFDLVSQVDSLCFIYRFGSEEYPEYACTDYNDVFGFFVQGPGYPTPTNIALIPNSQIPVAINNVHPANPDVSACVPYNAQYYVPDNVYGADCVFDGMTTTLAAKFIAVAGQNYHIKLAVADVGDGIYDSGVFIELSSLGQDSIFAPIAELSAPIINGDQVKFDNDSRYATSWFWDFGDGSTSTLRHPPAHTFALPASGTVSYTVKLITKNYCCFDTAVQVITLGTSSTIDEEQVVNQISVSPNPATDVVYVSLQNGLEDAASIEVFDISGALVRQIPLAAQLQNVEIRDLPAGFYTAFLMQNGRMVSRAKIQIR
jgi:PKD repeat protein